MAGTLEIITGLAKNSKEIFLKGVNDYLQRFPRGGAYKELKYSLDIPMYINLARKRGMDIDPEMDIDKKYHKYIPMGLVTNK
ncbi:MAG: hypothetical protein Q7U60_06160 [Candidatus Methanoperedens sp.]|nr:hypothetical protein [Candidatus Methanoperedens sp.]